MDFTNKLLQTVTYWAPGTPADGFGGQSFVAPVQFKARWEDFAQLVTDHQGQEVNSKTQVFLTDITTVGGYLYLGVSAAADPRTLDQAFEIKARADIPDLRLIQTLRMAYL